jgi:two-component system OmpR family sensor kinase
VSRGPLWRRLLPRRTLRARLIAGLVALLALGCAAVSVTAYLAARSSVTSALANQLQQDAAGWSSCMNDRAHYGNPPPQAGNRSDPRDSQICPGLGAGTFAAKYANGTFSDVGVIRDGGSGPRTEKFTLTAADQTTLKSLAAAPDDPAGASLPTYPRNLATPQLDGNYLLTAAKEPDGDILITGLPMTTMDQTLSTIAITSLIVFGAVLVLAGVSGTLWVRLSLRPLERVAATAAEVADLPLDSDDVELPAGVPDTDPETEAGRVGLSFNRMLGHVQSALARRASSESRLRRFAADASHELRTPLSAIRGYAELALRHPGPVPSEVTHALRRVEAESARMSVLVDDLLLLARLDAGRPLVSEPVDLSRLAIDATSDARVARPGHRWVLDLPDDPVQVTGDTLRLHQVLANLLSNAGRHTPAGTTVTVRLTENPAAPAGGSSSSEGYVRRGDVPPGVLVELSVTDEGPGVPPELLPELFERFTRADTARTHSDGSSTGLGLAIVDAVVAAHKGCITVISRPGLTRFIITLTAAPPDSAPDSAPGPSAAPARRRMLHRGP